MQRNISILGHENPTVSATSPIFPGDYDNVTSIYSSIFPPKHCLADYLNDGSSISRFPESNALVSYFPHIQQQMLHQDLMDRHHRVLSHFGDVAKQVHPLRQENVNLKMANLELTNRLNLLLNATPFQSMDLGPRLDSVMDRQENINIRMANLDLNNRLNLLLNAKPFHGVDVGPGLDSAVEELRNLGFGTEEEGTSENEAVGRSPTSVMDPGQGGQGEVERVNLPKSISVRSNGYLRTARAYGSSGKGADWVKPSNLTKKDDNGTQKVYVEGLKKEQPLELDVYNQGMFKTELCNKWQQTGTCPYGENCQFAHGIEELRPVLRHPRYKTQVCRMVLNGIPCPYGHRCHFRHTLTEQESLARAMNSSSLQPLNYR